MILDQQIPLTLSGSDFAVCWVFLQPVFVEKRNLHVLVTVDSFKTLAKLLSDSDGTETAGGAVEFQQSYRQSQHWQMLQ